ncbi:isoprenoid synthase domain-containing protein [Mycena belliarum]|uniref:Isoprenoid synthase domain-containing protein n=1 Tax=Mycena belliarum TaxID=1033014 RepID=A0AAD6UGG8_9AGAR|nr:isoprenoid synthase domain-containing protein [Mycena belliae]
MGEAYAELQLGSLIQSLLDAVSYKSPRAMMSAGSGSADALVCAMNAEVRTWTDDKASIPLFESMSKKAVSIVEFFYYTHPFEVKLAFAYYAWFFFYIDDVAPQADLEKFQLTALLGAPGPGLGPLAHFPRVLAALYAFYDPILANIMCCAALEFITATALEGRREVQRMPLRAAARAWPRYLRAKSGMAPGYAAAAFPRAAHPDISAFLQALPEIDTALALLNDILSFYKEDLAGETMNYVSVRAAVGKMRPRAVIMEMVAEVADLHARTAAILQSSPEAMETWIALEHGVIAWHFALPRYKLTDLGLTW